jgi:hypothetical protein
LPAEREPLRPHFDLLRRRSKSKRRVNSTLSDIYMQINIRNRYFLISTALVLLSPLWSLEPNDILIINVTPEDAKVSVSSDADYKAKVQEFRKVITAGLRLLRPYAKFIVIDIYMPKYFENEIDDKLLKELKATPQVTLATGHDAKREYTHKVFRKSVREAGHINVYYADEATFEFWPYICKKPDEAPAKYGKCPANQTERHIALIAADRVSGKNIGVREPRIILKRQSMRRFPQITFEAYQKDPRVAENKIVIIINRPFVNMDMHPLDEKTSIYGTEILANMILYYSHLADGM